MKKLIIVAHVCMLLFLTQGFSQPPVIADKIVGIVDDKIVLYSDIENQIQQYEQQYKQQVPDAFRCQLLDQILTQKLMLTQALLDSVEISDDEVNAELDKKIRYYSNLLGGQDELEKYYGKSIIELKDQFIPQIREQLLAQREQQGILTDIKVSPTEVKNYFASIPADSLPYYNSEVQLGEIIIYPKVNPEIKQYAFDQITELRNRVVIKGENFSNLAKASSQDPGSADDGGELGFRSRGELDPVFEAAAFALKNPGDVSDVIESSFGYHIIQLIERRGERVNVRHILIIPAITSADLVKASKLADSVRNEIFSGKLSFANAVNKFSMDDDSKNNGGIIMNPQTSTPYFETSALGDYDKTIVQLIADLKPGEISQPKVFTNVTNGKKGYRIIWLKTESAPHKANLKDDYDKIQAMALQHKQQEALTEWIIEKISKTYIMVDADYFNCNDLKKWISAK